jgi:hypothetical protein
MAGKTLETLVILTPLYSLIWAADIGSPPVMKVEP